MQNKELDIVIIADFCSNFDHKGNNRFIYLADLLVKEGHNVEIVTSNFSHGYKKPFDPIVREYDGAKITMLQEQPYKKNISIKRFFSHYSWGKRVGKYLKERNKPDVVYCAMPTLKAAKVAGKYCKKNSIKFIIDIQDLWPEAYKMVFNIPIISSLVFFPFNMIANSAYKMADEIIAVSQTYVDRAMKVNKKVKAGHSVFLGTDLTQFDKNVSEAKQIRKEVDEIWMGYCGTLGSSYDLKIVFDAMKILNNSNLRFIIMGDGPKREEFENYSKGLNVLYTGRLAYQDMCGVLSECDIVVNPIMHNAAQSIINKHADYAAVGRPVINTQENKEYRTLVDKYKMGFNIDNGDVASLADRLSLLISNPNKRTEMGANSRKCAEELFDRATSYNEITDLVINQIGGGIIVMLSNGQCYYKPQNEFWVGYCGSLSDSYDIKLIIDAIKMVNNHNIRFICMGDGYLKNEFEVYGEQKGINQTFTGRLEYSAMCQLLSCVDVVVNPIRGRSAASIINKHADYAASGKPVINTQQNGEYIRLMKDYDFGFSFNSDQVRKISDSISALSKSLDECARLGANGRKCAKQLFDRANIYKIIVNVVSR